MNPEKEVGKKIQEIRKQKKITQKELAELIGVATGTIQQYELGKRQPNLTQLEKIANALTVPLSALISPIERLTQMYIDCIKNGTDPSNLKRVGADIDSEIDKKISTVENFIFQKNLETEAIVSLINLRIGEKVSESIVTSLLNLNPTGQKKAADLVEDLAKIPDYQKDPKK